MKQLWNLLEQTLGADFAEDTELQHGVRALSAGFTADRSTLKRDYLDDPELQAAYLAYYVPLNFEKLYLLLSSQPGIWPKELDLDAPQRWLDFGSGPGTATLAALAAFKNRYKKLDRLPPIHVDLVDNQTGALNLADNLVGPFAKSLGLELTLELCTSLPSGRSYDLSLAANVLNELPPEDGPEARETLLKLWDRTAGVLFVLEPGHRVSSQRLVRFRERLLKADREHATLLGPCAHAEKCPVHRTKHWCHFAEPVTEGRLIDLNLRIFKDPRAWLKFSYLLARRGTATPAWDNKTFRAIGDLHPSGPRRLAIDLCKPEEKFALFVPANIPPDLRANLVRGALVTLDDDRQIAAKPLTKRQPAELRPRADRDKPRTDNARSRADRDKPRTDNARSRADRDKPRPRSPERPARRGSLPKPLAKPRPR